MDKIHRQIRTELRGMAPVRAIELVQSNELPAAEELCIIECDVRGKSCVQVADMLHVSLDGLHKIRRRAYTKLTNGAEK